jgi:hypothetical protein
MASSRTPWFRPKLFGVGVGPPIAWQGWVIMIAFVAGMVGAGTLLHGLIRGATVLVLAGVFLLVAKGRTTVPMRWRWGWK